ncbi:c-type cytochrome, partial [Kaarinaea lacus]
MFKINKLILSILVVYGTIHSSLIVAAEPEGQKSSQDMAELYTKYCSTCHGDRGDGNTRTTGLDPRPRDFTTANAAMDLTRERMIDAVTNGRPGTAMVAHKGRLSEEQIAGLVDYIRASFMRVPVAEQGGLPGAVSLGESVYTKNCSVCHGDKGNTAYWAKNGLNPPPRDFTSPEAMSDLNRKRMIQSVTHGRPGTGMMPFQTRLTAEEIASVVAFIRFKFMGVDPDKDTGAAPLAQMAKGAHPVVPSMPKTQETASPHAGTPGVSTTGTAPGTA